MTKWTTLSTICLLTASLSHSQTNTSRFSNYPPPGDSTLIPWLGSNGKVGYATESGRVVVAPDFDQLDILPAGELGASGTKNRMPLFFLRNGLVVAGREGYATPVVNFENENAAPDTLRQLWMVEIGGKKYLLNHQTNERHESWPSYSEYMANPIWFPIPYHEQKNEAGHFRWGLRRVFHESYRVNFVDENLRLIFPGDYSAAAQVSHNFFLLGDKHVQKVGVGDRSGKVRIPLVWENLYPASREGFFVVNRPRTIWKNRKTGQAGMLDADGKIVIDTIYEDIMSPGLDYLIVRTKTRSGVMDYAGNWVLPLDFEHIDRVFGDVFIANRPGGKFNLYDSKGQKLLPQDYTRIDRQGDYDQSPKFLILKTPSMLTVADSLGQAIFSEKLVNVSVVRLRYGTREIQFVSLKPVPGKPIGLYGLRDRNGRVILPEEHEQLGLLGDVAADLYIVAKGTFRGVFSPDGRAVLPLKFERIQTEEGQSDRIWAKLPGAKMYVAYGLDGQKLPLSERLKPDLDLENATGAGTVKRSVFSRKIISIETPDGLNYAIQDMKGRQIFKLEPDVEPHPMYDNDENQWNSYLVVQRHDDLLCGLLDSIGKTVLPFRFQNLQVVQPGKLLSRDNGGKTDLLDWQGELLFSAPKYAEFKGFDAPNGYRLASAKGLTVIFSPEGKYLRSVPGRFEQVAPHPDFQHFAIFTDESERKKFWADLVSGRVFRE